MKSAYFLFSINYLTYTSKQQQYMETGITKENMFTDYNFTAYYNTVWKRETMYVMWKHTVGFSKVGQFVVVGKKSKGAQIFHSSSAFLSD